MLTKIKSTLKGWFRMSDENVEQKPEEIHVPHIPGTVTAEGTAEIPKCEHKWIRGMLPGQIYVKTCRLCNSLEKISMTDWNKL